MERLRFCLIGAGRAGPSTGVTYSAIGRRLDRMPRRVYGKHAASTLKKAAKLGQKLGVTVGIEPLNRYEPFLVNTCEQALALPKMVGEPDVAVHLDPYHMNIEETDFYGPTKRAAPFLCHYHLSESHRGTVGTGTVDGEGIMRALAEKRYRGLVGVAVTDARRIHSLLTNPAVDLHPHRQSPCLSPRLGGTWSAERVRKDGQAQGRAGGAVPALNPVGLRVRVPHPAPLPTGTRL